MSDDDPGTHRVFLIGAGFSKLAGLPLATELLESVKEVVSRFLRHEGFSHFEKALDDYQVFIGATSPGRRFDLEEFGAWLDWEHTLRLRGSDTFSDQGNQAGLQLRWAIGKVLHDLTPQPLPDAYLRFAEGLNVTDHVLTLNYDLVLERALDSVGLPYRRYPGRYSEVHEGYAVWDQDEPRALRITKLHGSIDWTEFGGQEERHGLNLVPLVEGPRPTNDLLQRVGVISRRDLASYYATTRNWWGNPPLLMPPSNAKPLARSPLVDLWDAVGTYAAWFGGLTVVGCSLPPGDPYMLQVMYRMATDYAWARPRQEMPWRQARIKLVDFRATDHDIAAYIERFRFIDFDQTDLYFGGFDGHAVEMIFDQDVSGL